MSANGTKSARPRVLVADDAPICREPIAAILNDNGFDTELATTGDEVLAKLRSSAFDLILLDIRMPGMDGLTALEHIREDIRWRELPVVLLTEHASEQLVRRAVKLGVQEYFLKANFSIGELLARINRQLSAANAAEPTAGAALGAAAPAEAVEGNSPDGQQGDVVVDAPGEEAATQELPKLRKGAVLDKVRQALQLRPVPPVLQYVIAQTNSTRTSIDDVVNTLRQDQALSLRVMKVANSSFYSTGKKAQSLSDAGQRIGMSGIRNAVVAVAAMEHFGECGQEGIVPQRFWEHSLCAAILAQFIGEKLNAENAEELFLAGLMHDVGRLLLVTEYPEQYTAVLHAADHPNGNLSTVERRVFGVTHADITREFLMHVGMPEEILTASSMHELSTQEIQRDKHAALSALVISLANRLAHALLIGDSGNRRLLRIDHPMKALGLSPEAVAAIADRASVIVRDTELFYACRGDTTFLDPLSKELTKAAPASMKVCVFSPLQAAEPLALLLEQLNWLEKEQPRRAVVCARSARELEQQLHAVQAYEAPRGLALPILFASPDGTLAPARDARAARQIATTRLTARYTDIIAAIGNLPAAAQATPAETAS